MKIFISIIAFYKYVCKIERWIKYIFPKSNTIIINYFIRFLEIIDETNFYWFLSDSTTNITFFYLSITPKKKLK